jgi:hypothetical protein
MEFIDFFHVFLFCLRFCIFLIIFHEKYTWDNQRSYDRFLYTICPFISQATSRYRSLLIYIRTERSYVKLKRDAACLTVWCLTCLTLLFLTRHIGGESNKLKDTISNYNKIYFVKTQELQAPFINPGRSITNTFISRLLFPHNYLYYWFTYRYAGYIPLCRIHTKFISRYLRQLLCYE